MHAHIDFYLVLDTHVDAICFEIISARAFYDLSPGCLSNFNGVWSKMSEIEFLKLILKSQFTSR